MPPRSAANQHASSADVAACRATLRGGSRTFFAASLVLPKSVRKPATALYAFCRMADDVIDQGLDRAAALRDLHDRSRNVFPSRSWKASNGMPRAAAMTICRN